MKAKTATIRRTTFRTGLAGFAAGAELPGEVGSTATGAVAGLGTLDGGVACAGAAAWKGEVAPQFVQNCIPSPTAEPHFVQNLAMKWSFWREAIAVVREESRPASASCRRIYPPPRQGSPPICKES